MANSRKTLFIYDDSYHEILMPQRLQVKVFSSSIWSKNLLPYGFSRFDTPRATEKYSLKKNVGKIIFLSVSVPLIENACLKGSTKKTEQAEPQFMLPVV